MRCCVCQAYILGSGCGIFQIFYPDGSMRNFPYCEKHREEAHKVSLEAKSNYA